MEGEGCRAKAVRRGHPSDLQKKKKNLSRRCFRFMFRSQPSPSNMRGLRLPQPEGQHASAYQGGRESVRVTRCRHGRCPRQPASINLQGAQANTLIVILRAGERRSSGFSLCASSECFRGTRRCGAEIAAHLAASHLASIS